jgi:hypothetical protein
MQIRHFILMNVQGGCSQNYDRNPGNTSESPLKGTHLYEFISD